MKTAAEEPEKEALDQHKAAQEEKIKQREESEQRDRQSEALQAFTEMDVDANGM